MKWIVGADHAGLELKGHLVEVLRRLGDEVEDLGTHSSASVDYPDFAVQVARRVAGGEGRGLLVCGTGVGMAMAANKVPGIRAAVVTDVFTARMTRAHNDANLIAVGARVIGSGVAEEALRAFRDTSFEGGRHATRVAKVDDLDRSR
ncbi:MAG TPA: ribose 5-phosphate isomerase B [Kofleriaceae bacterium]|nr:ribose 5-phosphate isomerase B [Kofleriaceae bacterium]